MSRVGKRTITIPTGVSVDIMSGSVAVKGPKGSLEVRLHPHVSVMKDDGGVHVSVTNSLDVGDRSLWGLFNGLITNAVKGVASGFEKKLEVNGVGYRVASAGQALKLELGFSHPVEFKLPAGISAAVEKNIITISGADKALVGETAARIRAIRKPEPYKGKGIKYIDEVIRRKAGKTAKTAAA